MSEAVPVRFLSAGAQKFVPAGAGGARQGKRLGNVPVDPPGETVCRLYSRLHNVQPRNPREVPAIIGENFGRTGLFQIKAW